MHRFLASDNSGLSDLEGIIKRFDPQSSPSVIAAVTGFSMKVYDAVFHEGAMDSEVLEHACKYYASVTLADVLEGGQ